MSYLSNSQMRNADPSTLTAENGTVKQAIQTLKEQAKSLQPSFERETLEAAALVLKHEAGEQ